MASIEFKDASLRLYFDAGTDGEGKPVTRTKVYRNVSGSADAEELLAAVIALGGLSERQFISADRIETAFIMP
ncbi:DUF1659 domain-containing protein [Edaphobacillus lindanitolerans]|uniref:DUF1659 domain-containing protein n=1 Tax=Edaphobacillus lindanitolerans TaxID=550447 RepID=A0A1U7PPP1_9BACI|nr:DUF1659 domain-containing protein [Edaphobacillus lindanitolerans]SIT81166.1 Protein of unknown function [Edaphobacillus lindanitolerans]